MKGFRVPAQGSKNDQLRELKTELTNMQMAGRISQMMTQQLMQSVKSMSQDLGFALNQLQELQYKHNAAVKLLKISSEELEKLSNEQRLIDFNEASQKADAKEQLIAAEVISDDSTVTMTSVANDADGKDCGIFRSRIKLSESGVPDLISGLKDKKVGDKIHIKMNGLDHEVEVLAIRNPSLVEAPAATEATH